MSKHATRDRLVCPIAGILTVGLLSAPQSVAPDSSPRFAEVAAVRLQAEVTSLVSGVADSAPAAAAATATASATGGTYPSTIFDKILYNLPPKIREVVIPPLYVLAMALGAIMGVVYTVLGWPAATARAAAAASPTPVRPLASPVRSAQPRIPANDETAVAIERHTRPEAGTVPHSQARRHAPKPAAVIGDSAPEANVSDDGPAVRRPHRTSGRVKSGWKVSG